MIINSLLDTDLYKFTMQQAVFHQFPDVMAEFEFKCRNKNPKIDLLLHKKEIEEEINQLEKLKFKVEELLYLSTPRFIKNSYIQYLKNFRLRPDPYVHVDEKDKELTINIKGPWLETMLFEVPVLTIISETYSGWQACASDGLEPLDKKIKQLKSYNNKTKTFPKFSDFGTRRRFGHRWQKRVLETLKKELPNNFIGTSNVLFAKELNIKPIGTMAHEWLQAGQGMEKRTSIKYSQRYMLQAWANEYRGDLGIALSDTLGFDVFLNDFDMYFAKLFDGCRHDSGDPYWWCNKLIKHYNKMDIESKGKTAVFSDGLNFQKMIDLHKTFDGRIKTAYGIGTNITNDCGFKAPQIVIKMTKCQNNPVAKISDSPGKQMCKDKEYLKRLVSVFNIKRKGLYD